MCLIFLFFNLDFDDPYWLMQASVTVLSFMILIWIPVLYLSRLKFASQIVFNSSALEHICSSHCNLVISYGEKDLGQHWLR